MLRKIIVTFVVVVAIGGGILITFGPDREGDVYVENVESFDACGRFEREECGHVERIRKEGRQLMQERGVRVERNERYQDWTEPDMIVSDGITYDISSVETLRPTTTRFLRLSPNRGTEEILVVLVVGDDECMATEVAFGNVASTCATARGRENCVIRKVSKDILQISTCGISPGGTEHFVSKNIYLSVSGATNALSIARAIFGFGASDGNLL